MKLASFLYKIGILFKYLGTPRKVVKTFFFRLVKKWSKIFLTNQKVIKNIFNQSKSGQKVIKNVFDHVMPGGVFFFLFSASMPNEHNFCEKFEGRGNKEEPKIPKKNPTHIFVGRVCGKTG